MLRYDRSLELRVQGQWGLFELETANAGHGFHTHDAGALFLEWLGANDLRAALRDQPDELGSVLSEFEDHVVERLGLALAEAGESDMVALKRCGALFGLASLSNVVARIEQSVRGRLLLAFAGRYENGGYKLLDARRGWNYHAVPIPSEPLA